MVLPSEEVIDKPWSSVKIYGSSSRSKYWVRDIFLYSVTLPTRYNMVYLPLAPLAFVVFSTKWAFQFTPSKRSAVFTASNLGYASTKIELLTSGVEHVYCIRINNK